MQQTRGTAILTVSVQLSAVLRSRKVVHPAMRYDARTRAGPQRSFRLRSVYIADRSGRDYSNMPQAFRVTEELYLFGGVYRTLKILGG